MDELTLADGARMIMPNGAVLERPEIEDLQRGLKLAFSDWRCDVERAVRSGDTLMVELRYSGTHDGPLSTGVSLVPPTGARVSYRSCDVLTLRDGKVIEWRSYFDPSQLFGEIMQADACAA